MEVYGTPIHSGNRVYIDIFATVGQEYSNPQNLYEHEKVQT